MSAVKSRATLALLLAGAEAPQADSSIAPPTTAAAPQFRQRPPIHLVPAPSHLQTGPADANDRAAISSSKQAEPDLRWLGSLICMMTAVTSASTMAWILF